MENHGREEGAFGIRTCFIVYFWEKMTSASFVTICKRVSLLRINLFRTAYRRLHHLKKLAQRPRGIITRLAGPNLLSCWMQVGDSVAYTRLAALGLAVKAYQAKNGAYLRKRSSNWYRSISNEFQTIPTTANRYACEEAMEDWCSIVSGPTGQMKDASRLSMIFRLMMI